MTYIVGWPLGFTFNHKKKQAKRKTYNWQTLLESILKCYVINHYIKVACITTEIFPLFSHNMWYITYAKSVSQLPKS